MNAHALAAVIRHMNQVAGRSRRPGVWAVPALSMLLSTGLLHTAGLQVPLQAKPADQSPAAGSVPLEARDNQASVQPLLAQAASPAAQEQPSGPPNKVAETAKKKGQPSLYGTVTKPGFFALVEQTTNWTFQGTGSAWGTGAAAGATFVGFGVSGNIRGSKDNLLSWSAQLGPLFQHTYNVPGRDRTPLRMDVSSFLSPLVGDDLQIYALWRGIAGNDVAGQSRFENTVRAGILYSFAKSRIIPDAIELINLPERGFYGRVEPSWIFSVNGQLSQVQTQAYLGLAETWYPFTLPLKLGRNSFRVLAGNCRRISAAFLISAM